MLVHGGVGGTNNHCRTEGNWGGVKKAVCGTAGSFCGLAVRSVLPSLIRFQVDESKEQAYWKGGTKKRASASRAKFAFPLPHPIKEDWTHLESLPPNILEICTVFARPEVKTAWEVHIQDIVQAAEEEGVSNSPAHMQIRAMFTAKPKARAPSRNTISYIIMLSTKYLIVLTQIGA
jgi:hypothetical protein